jgi:hypothetical protein
MMFHHIARRLAFFAQSPGRPTAIRMMADETSQGSLNQFSL